LVLFSLSFTTRLQAGRIGMAIGVRLSDNRVQWWDTTVAVRKNLTFQRPALLAGWLFADLFLVLFLVTLASLPSSPHKQNSPPPPPPPPRALDKPVSFTLNVQPSAIQDPATKSAADTQLVQALEGKLAASHLAGRQAGVLLVFASGPPDGIDQAIANANSVISVVRARVPGFGQVSPKGYWSGAGDDFEFEIFFFSAAPS
jgi:hypothetical protein